MKTEKEIRERLEWLMKNPVLSREAADQFTSEGIDREVAWHQLHAKTEIAALKWVLGERIW